MREKEENNELTKRFYKIGDVAEILGEAPSTLRFWEKEFPECRPVRSQTNRRYYTPEAVEQLKVIRFLLREKGMKIEAAKSMLASNPMTVSRRVTIIEELEMVRDHLQMMLKALEKRR